MQVRGVDVGVEARHAFRSKQFRKTQRCDLCQQPLRDQGASCRACKYCCHLHCEPKHGRCAEKFDKAATDERFLILTALAHS
ncbi:hypothetical protein V5799_011791 [Amblyomma americanum]|uniref:Phorbol-ester/DAG-type domain-containing protein n=1 Tax=Amblyomma americanum TaxID=6943 RepID=A0AAQ4EG46_AMBAM